MLLLKRLGVQSRLVVLLLCVSLGSILTVGYVAYSNATEALTTRTITRLENLRRSRSSRIKEFVDLMRNQVITLSETGSVIDAMKEFRSAFKELRKMELPPPQLDKLRSHYETDFIPKLKNNVDGEPILESYFPQPTAARYLQFHYIASNPHHQGERNLLDSARDGTTYSAVHEKHHPFLRRYMKRFGFRDIMLIDPESGEIIYTCEKTTELGRTLYSGPFSESNLAELVRSLRKQSDRRTFRIADFESYIACLGQPSAFVASPIFDGPDRIGILVMQFPVDTINRIVSGNRNWKRDGLGSTGEVYIVGSDHLLRTSNRAVNTDLDEYLRTLRKAGYSPGAINRIKNFGTPILQQSVKSSPVEKALLGQEGIETYHDFSGNICLASFGPLEIDGLHWVIVAKISRDEAFSSAYELGQKILLVLVIVALVVSVLAVILAKVYVRPVEKIREAVRALSEGRRDVTVNLETRDEFHELAVAFNEMSVSLISRSDLLEQQRRENEELLDSVLPGPAVARVREGNLNAIDTFAELTLLQAELLHVEGLYDPVPMPERVKWVDDLVDAFDDVADQFGIEKIRTHKLTYLAACGLSVARVDHANRCLDFAQEILRVVHRFNKEWGTSISLKIGIHSGSVVGNLIGRRKFAFELWGESMDYTSRLAGLAEEGTILISTTVQDKLRGIVDVSRVPEIQTEESLPKGPRSSQAA